MYRPFAMFLAPCSGGCTSRYRRREEEEQGREREMGRRCGPTAMRRAALGERGVLASDPQRPSLRLTDGGRKALREPAGCGAAKTVQPPSGLSAWTERPYSRLGEVARVRRDCLRDDLAGCGDRLDLVDRELRPRPGDVARLKGRREAPSSSASRSRASSRALSLELRDNPSSCSSSSGDSALSAAVMSTLRRGCSGVCFGLLTRGQSAPAPTVSLRSQDERCRVDVAPSESRDDHALGGVDQRLDDIGPRLKQRRLSIDAPVER